MRPPSGILGVRRGRLAGGLLAAAVLVVYANSLGGPFIFDDVSSIPANPTIRHFWPLWVPLLTPKGGGVTVAGRPILNASFALDYALAGNAVWIFHLTNLLVHILAVLTFFGVVGRTLEARTIDARNPDRTFPRDGSGAGLLAWTIAFAWGLHPLLTESVTYIVQRAESLMGFFYLFTLYAFIRSVERPTVASADPARISSSAVTWSDRRWQALAVLACAAGMGTKEVMVSAPFMVLLYDRTFVAGSFGAAFRRRGGFYTALAATWIPLGVLLVAGGGNRGGSIGFGVGVGWWEHFWTQFPAILKYLQLSLWPQPLVFEYEPQWAHLGPSFVLSVLVVGLLLCGTIFALIRRSPWGFLGAWFFAILAPTSLMPAPSQLIVEHRMYLPLAAVITTVAFCLRALMGARGALLLLVAGIAGGALTIARNGDYRTELGLWSDTVAKRPANALAHEMLAEAMDHAGRGAEAIDQHTLAIRLRPNLAVAHELLGDELMRSGRGAEALAEYETVLRLKPDSVDAHNNLGAALSRAGRTSEALPHFQAAMRIMPELPEAHYNLANVLAETGNQPAAIAEYERALQLRPDYFEARLNLANALSAAGKGSAALKAYEDAIHLRPNSSRAHLNFGNALAVLGRMTEAAVEYQEVLRLDPNSADAHGNLGSAFLEEGRVADAIGEYEIALRLDPGAEDVRKALGRLKKSRTDGQEVHP